MGVNADIFRSSLSVVTSLVIIDKESGQKSPKTPKGLYNNRGQ